MSESLRYPGHEAEQSATIRKPREPKGAEETIYELESLKELYDAILDRWRRYKRHHSELPKELSERFALVYKIRHSGERSPVVVFEFLSNYGCLRLNFWRVDNEKKRILLTPDIYTLGEDGKTRGKGRVAMHNVLELLQEFANKSGYSVSEVMITNTKSTPLVADDPTIRHIEDVESFAGQFFNETEAQSLPRSDAAQREDGKTRGKGRVAMHNVLELLQEFANKSGYSVSEVMITNTKSTPLVADDPTIRHIEDVESFAGQFFNETEQETKEAFIRGLGDWEARVRVFRPGMHPKGRLPKEDEDAMRGMAYMTGIRLSENGL
jgi:hypothetical protein